MPFWDLSLLECSTRVCTLADKISEVFQPCGNHGKCPASTPWKFFAHPCGVSAYTCAALYSARELRNCLWKFLESSSFLSGTLSYRFHLSPPSLLELWSLSPQLNMSTMLCLASPFLYHGLECASRQKVGAIVAFIWFVCDRLVSRIIVLCCL